MSIRAEATFPEDHSEDQGQVPPLRKVVSPPAENGNSRSLFLIHQKSQEAAMALVNNHAFVPLTDANIHLTHVNSTGERVVSNYPSSHNIEFLRMVAECKLYVKPLTLIVSEPRNSQCQTYEKMFFDGFMDGEADKVPYAALFKSKVTGKDLTVPIRNIEAINFALPENGEEIADAQLLFRTLGNIIQNLIRVGWQPEEQ